MTQQSTPSQATAHHADRDQQTAAQPAIVVVLPLESVALSRAPNRQIRDVREEDVQALIESDPAGWDPIIVRSWPDGEAYPVGEEGRDWQVVAGYHRVTAARRMGLPTINATIRYDITDDRTFMLVALSSNLRHGVRQSKADSVAVMKMLRDTFKMSVRDIARDLGMKVGTVQNWLSGRDPNAASKQASHNATSKQQSGEAPSPMSVSAVPKQWQVAPTVSLSAEHFNRIDTAIYTALRVDPSASITPADALAWARELSPVQRNVLGRGIPQLAQFWTQLSHAIGATSEPDSESATDDFDSDSGDAEESE